MPHQRLKGVFMSLRQIGLAMLITTCSFAAFAGVSIQEKEDRVHFIENLGVVAPSLSVDAYKRELEYERQGLPLDIRAYNEARRLAEQIQEQIVTSYEMAIQEHGDTQKAISDISQAIYKDLELAHAEFKHELLSLSMKTLLELESGRITTNNSRLSNLQKVILSNVQERAEYLNRELPDPAVPQLDFVPANDGDSGRLEYNNTNELMESLVSDRPNSRWVTMASKSISSAESITVDANISYQIKIDFLGVAVEAGPTISFKRSYSSSAIIMAEELDPILQNNGRFDVHKRDENGKIVYVNGIPQRRFLAFFCTADLSFSTDYIGAGVFRVAGVGASSSVSNSYSNRVTQNSRRIMVPDYVGGRTVTLARLAEICHRHFLNARINSNITVTQSLNIEMKNIVSSLRFSHPKTKCAVDTDCIPWYNREVMNVWKHQTYPRCFEESREKFRSCELRGLEGKRCKVFKDGKRVSIGNWEIDCDKGLRCVAYQEETWRRPARGICRPINSSTYRDPKKYPEYRTRPFQIDLVEFN
jgi:hypothetical protein